MEKQIYTMGERTKNDNSLKLTGRNTKSRFSVLASTIAFMVFALFFMPQVMQARTASQLVGDITTFSTNQLALPVVSGGGLLATIDPSDPNTVLVIGDITNAAQQLQLSIDPGVTVKWNATLTGTGMVVLNLIGPGSFTMLDGLIEGTNGTNSLAAIQVSGSVTLSIENGMVKIPWDGGGMNTCAIAQPWNDFLNPCNVTISDFAKIISSNRAKAIKVYGAVSFTGGLLFTYGLNISCNQALFIDAPPAIITGFATAATVAWNMPPANPTTNRQYEQGSTTDLCVENTTAYWDKQGGEFGILILYGSQNIFIPIDEVGLKVKAELTDMDFNYPAIADYTFNCNPQGITLSDITCVTFPTLDVETTATLTFINKATLAQTNTRPTDAGCYEVWLYVPASTDYLESNVKLGESCINKATLGGGDFSQLAGLTAPTFDCNEHGMEISNLFFHGLTCFTMSATTVELLFSGTLSDGSLFGPTTNKPVDAGAYRVDIHVLGDDNFAEVTINKGWTFNINKATLSGTDFDYTLALSDYEYNCARQGPDLVTDIELNAAKLIDFPCFDITAGVVLSYSGILFDGSAYGPSPDKPEFPGNYKILFSITGDNNFTDVLDIDNNWEFNIINAKTDDAAYFSYIPNPAESLYDGFEHGVQVTYEGSAKGCIVATIDVYYQDINGNDLGANKPPIDVGIYKIIIQVTGGTHIDGIAGLYLGDLTIKPNYQISDFDCDPISLESTYNGSPGGDTGGVTVTPLLAGCDGTITVHYTDPLTLADIPYIDAGIYSIFIDVAGSTDPAYDITGFYLGDFTIKPAVLTFSIKNEIITVGDPAPTPTILVSGLQGAHNINDVVDPEPTADYEPGFNPNLVGIYQINFATNALLKNSNYVINYQHGATITVVAAGVIIPRAADFNVFIPTGHVFNAQPQGGVTVTPKVPGVFGAITIFYNRSIALPINAGTYTVTIDVAPGPGSVAITNLYVGDYTIDKKTVYVIPDDHDTDMNGDLPTYLPITFVGFYLPDNETNALTVQPLARFTVSHTRDIGTFDIVFERLGVLNNRNGANYILQHVNATHRIVDPDPTVGIGFIKQDNNPLKAWVQRGTLHVSGLTIGKPWSLYSLTGTLIRQGFANSNEVEISLNVRGVFIIRSEKGIMKVIY